MVFPRTSATIHLMDEVAPRIRRSDRPMASQDAGRGNDGRRRGAGGFGTLDPTDDGNLSLGRRIGVLVVLAALGGAIVLAAGGVGGNNGTAPLPVATVLPTSGAVAAATGPLASPPTAAPEITTPAKALITDRTIDLRVSVPEPGTTMTGLEVRIYRNSTLLASKPISRTGRVRVKDVPLRRGTNRLTATLANPGGEGPRSAVVSVAVDDVAPRIAIKSPRSGATLNRPVATIQGKTEAGLTVSIRNATTDAQVTEVADATGAFAVPLDLDPGRNTITIQTRDVAGNKGTRQLFIVRGNGKPSVQLELSRQKVKLRALPITLVLKATVLDADGRPVPGARVTFTLTPPNLPLDTFEAVSGANGVATSRVRLIRTGATRGDVLVTVEAVLPDGDGKATRTTEFPVD